MTSRPRRGPSTLGVLAVSGLVVLAACSGGDDGSDAPPVAPTVAPTTTVTVEPPSTTTTVAPSTTTTRPAGPPLSERLSLVEVSLSLAGPAAPEQVVSISVDDVALADVVDEGVDATPAWCSGVIEPDATTLVVRVGPPAVVDATGGIERFELLADVAADARQSAATLTVVVDGATITADGEVRLLGDAADSGAFSGTAPDGTTVEGAFRCA